MATLRKLSNLQKKILIYMLSFERQFSGPVPARCIIKSLRSNCVYSSCASLAVAGLVHQQREFNRRVFIGLTDAGRAVAASLMPKEYRQQRQTGNRILPFRPQKKGMRDMEVDIRGRLYTVSRAALVIRHDGTVSLALWSENNGQAWLSGHIRQVSEWYQACYDAGLPVNVQVEADRGLDGLGDRLPGR